MNNNKIKQILLSWQMNPQTITSIYSSAWDIDGCYVLKHGSNIAEIEKSLRLSKLLNEEEMPVVEYIETMDGEMFVSDDIGYYCLILIG